MSLLLRSEEHRGNDCILNERDPIGLHARPPKHKNVMQNKNNTYTRAEMLLDGFRFFSTVPGKSELIWSMGYWMLVGQIRQDYGEKRYPIYDQLDKKIMEAFTNNPGKCWFDFDFPLGNEIKRLRVHCGKINKPAAPCVVIMMCADEQIPRPFVTRPGDSPFPSFKGGDYLPMNAFPHPIAEISS